MRFSSSPILINTSGGGGSGVTDINGATGSITLVGGTDISITQAPAGTFTFDFTGPASSSWLLLGNAGTTNSTINGAGVITGGNFLGTTDAATLTFAQNNVRSGFIDGAHGLTFFGQVAGVGSTGVNNTFIGLSSGQNNAANDVTAVGYNSASGNTGGFVSALGLNSALNNSGINLVAVGLFAASGNTANNVVALGAHAADGNHNTDLTAVGTSAGQGNSGNFATFVGSTAGNGNIADNVTGVGFGSATANSGSYFTGLGFNTVVLGALTNSTAVGANAIVQSANTMVLGSIKNLNTATTMTQVAIGIPQTTSNFQVTDVQYNTGTASQVGNTITGVGTTFTSNMKGSILIFHDGTKRTIQTVTDAVTLNVTPAGAVASQAYNIYFNGVNVNNTITGDGGAGLTSVNTGFGIVNPRHLVDVTTATYLGTQTFSGVGLNDATLSGVYTGNFSHIGFFIEIDSLNTQTIDTSAESGPFTIGEIVTESVTGFTGTVLLDEPGSLLNERLITITGVTGTFSLGHTITGGTSGSTAPEDIAVSAVTDTYKWYKKTVSASTDFFTPLSTSVHNLGFDNPSFPFSGTDHSDGIRVKFGAITGHTIGDIWEIQAENPTKINTDGTYMVGGIDFMTTTGSVASFFRNVIIGEGSGQSITPFVSFLLRPGQGNLIIGDLSGIILSSGQANVIIGPGAGQTLTTGDNNIILGISADVTNGSDSNTFVVGADTGSGREVPNWKVNGIPWVMPAVQGGSSTVLTNDGTGVLSWSAAPVVISNTVSTTDATPTTIQTNPLDAATTTSFNCTIVARRTGGVAGTAEDGGRWQIKAVFKNVAGIATQIGSTTVIADSDQGTWDADFFLTGVDNNVTIKVTGAVNNNVDWKIISSIDKVS